METPNDTDLELDDIPTTNFVCQCEHCAGGRLVHWKCDSPDCEAPGPFRFSHADPPGVPMRTPYGQRQYNDTEGKVAGIRRWCSARCALSEERIYLINLLTKAQARRDMETIRVVTGRLHELAQKNPAIISTVPEPLQRTPARAASLTDRSQE